MNRAGLTGADFNATRPSVVQASRPRSSGRVLLRRPPRLSPRAEDALDRLYAAISVVAANSVVVDASKFPGYADALSACSTIDVSVCHLVRDPEGVFLSATRAKPRSDLDASQLLPAHGKVTTIAKWIAANELIAMRWGRERGYVRVKYSDFVRQPERQVQRIGEAVGLGDGFPIDEFGSFEVSEEHLIGSNPDRAMRGRLHIRPESTSVNRLRNPDKTLVGTLTWPTRMHLGVR
jgi:hypothetical protein